MAGLEQAPAITALSTGLLPNSHPFPPLITENYVIQHYTVL